MGLPRCNSELLQSVVPSGAEALIEDKQDWGQLAHERYQVCVWQLAQAARHSFITYPRLKTWTSVTCQT